MSEIQTAQTTSQPAQTIAPALATQTPAQSPAQPATMQQQPAQTVADKPKTLRETIRAAVKAAPQKDPETGKFVAATAAQSAPTKDRAAVSLGTPSQVQPQTTPAPVAVKAPDSWTKEMKAKFAELPPEAQAYINQRESEVTRKLTSQDEDRTLGRRVKEMAQPYAHLIAMENATVDAAFGDYLRTAAILRQGTPQQKMVALQTIARQFNVPLGVPPQQGQQLPPEIQRIAQEVEGLKQQRQTEAQQQQLREQAELNAEIEGFSASPDHEHFETVRDTMAAFLMGDKTGRMTLQQAYDQAIWAHPEIRSTLIQSQTAAAEQARRAQAQQQVEASRQAAVSVTGGPGGTQPAAQKPNGSLRDQLKANFRAVTQGGGRV